MLSLTYNRVNRNRHTNEGSHERSNVSLPKKKNQTNNEDTQILHFNTTDDRKLLKSLNFHELYLTDVDSTKMLQFPV